LVPWSIRHAVSSRARQSILVLFLTLATVATVQRGVLTRSHATFPIFRQSFVHLSTGRDLYARYPDEQGSRDDDRFKYTPSAAVFFAPFAMVPFVLALFLWTALNVLALFFAVDRLIPGRDGTVALLIVFPALIAAIQSTSSNAVIAALMVASFVALEGQRVFRASMAIAAGALMKLYPAAAVPFLLTQPKPGRAIAKLALVVAVLLAVPLLVTGPTELLAQYRSWASILFSDERDLTFARSIMVTIRDWTGTTGPNWLFQAVATMILVTPLAVRRSAWSDPAYRKNFLASLLIYVVIFNHQAENSSYVIAAVGLALWFLTSDRSWPRIILLLLCVAGLEAIPYTIVWLWLQFDLLDGARLGAWIARKLPERSRMAPETAEA
jgi:glycosyl transferase family 87